MTQTPTTDHGRLDGLVALVIDDDADNRFFLDRWLSAEGVEVIEAATGAEGLARARDLPDLIVCDVRLPDIDGRSVTATLRKDPSLSHVPIIQRSSSAIDAASRIEGLASGADAYLVEPIDRDLLVATARSLLRFQRSSEQLLTRLTGDVTGVFELSVASSALQLSDSLHAIHGTSASEFGGTLDAFLQLVHPDDRSRVEYVIDIGLHVDDTIEFDFRFIRRDGSTGWIESRAQVFRNVRGEPVRLLGFSHDVTERTIQANRITQLQTLAAELNTRHTTTNIMWALDDTLQDTGVSARWPVDPATSVADAIARYRTRAGDLVLGGASSDRGITGEQAQALCEITGGALDRALRYEHEVATAATLQQALLPELTPEIDGWTLTTRFLPERQVDRVSGDLYDVMELDDSFIVVVGEVFGDGSDALRQVGAIRTLIRTVAVSESGDPAAMLRRATELYVPVFGTEAPFATLLVVAISYQGGVTFASAGHPAPIHGTPAGIVLLDAAPSSPLGVDQQFRSVNGPLDLDSGDWIACYTDGVFSTGAGSLEVAVTHAMTRIRSVDADAVLAAGDAAADLRPDDRTVVTVRRA